MTNPGYQFYKNVLGSPKYVLAPMVEQSELAFRFLCRENGAQLCYTPMWHAGIFSKDTKYRTAAIESAPTDRPLLFQVNICLFFFQQNIHHGGNLTFSTTNIWNSNFKIYGYLLNQQIENYFPAGYK